MKDVISADAAADAGGRSEVLVQSWTSNIICFKPLTALLRQQAVCFAQASFSQYWRSFLTVGSCVCEGTGIGLTRPNCKHKLPCIRRLRPIHMELSNLWLCSPGHCRREEDVFLGIQEHREAATSRRSQGTQTDRRSSRNKRDDRTKQNKLSTGVGRLL